MIEAELSPQSRAALEAKQKQFNRVARSIENREPANRRAAVSLYGWIIRNFDSAGGSVGGWTPLKPATIRRKAKAGKEKMLVMTGRLRNSFRQFYDREVAGVGSDVTYSEQHEEGSGRIPRRRMLPTQEAALDIGIKVYDFYVKTAINQ